MAPSTPLKLAVIGASGYTGADAVRLAVRHPGIALTGLVAKTHAGKPIAQVFPHLAGLGLPDLIAIEDLDTSNLDAVICGLPHATAHTLIAALPDHVRVVDMSADFRLRDVATYEQWYGITHPAPHLIERAVYGLTEAYRSQIADARLVACPGCYPTATLLALRPLVHAGVITTDDVIIDAKSGVSGAGRGLKQNLLFCEAGEGVSPYGVSGHRHAPEIEQELGAAAGSDVVVNFTPHLIPMSRGELVTCHVRLAEGQSVADARACLQTAYDREPFIRVLPEGTVPGTQMVRGSNLCAINVFPDRIAGRAIVIAALDNLVKGSAGQALQNLNVMFGMEETTGLEQVALFP